MTKSYDTTTGVVTIDSLGGEVAGSRLTRRA